MNLKFFLFLHILSKKAYKFKGQLFATYLMWYGLGRVIFEGLRTDSLMIGSLRVSQLLSALLIVAGAGLHYVLARRAKLAALPVEEHLFSEPEAETDVKAEEITTLTLNDVDEETEQTEEQQDGEDH